MKIYIDLEKLKKSNKNSRHMAGISGFGSIFSGPCDRRTILPGKNQEHDEYSNDCGQEDHRHPLWTGIGKDLGGTSFTPLRVAV